MGLGIGKERVFALLLVLALLVEVAITQSFLEIPFNKEQYFGPDGPWQAITVDLEYPTDSTYSTINVYPAVMYDTIASYYIPTNQACSGNGVTGNDNCGVGGTLSPLSYTNGSWWYTYFNDATGFYFYLNGSTASTNLQLPNNIIFNNMLTDVCNIAQMTYPNGNVLPVEVGYACLGGSPLATSLSTSGALQDLGWTPSDSYGLHIGAAGLNYPGSLIFGGYDRGRVIGPVIKYDAHSELALIDIEIGVETGGSPFNFYSKTDLMQIPSTGEFTGSLPTLLKPEYPYIYLNQETLDAITAVLPVTFSQKAGFYLWNTDDPMYKKILSSPAYLGFVFPSQTGNTANTTIKVPFSLLNLTLESSASGLKTDVPYIPFMATNLGGDSSLDILLGRGFLQAAFMGTNWNTNTSWLAQAPGPGSDGQGLGYSPVDTQHSQTTLNVREGADLFKDSWAGHWTPISAEANSSGSENGGSGSSGSGSSSGLSGGAIAGIVVGAVAVIAIIAAIIACIMIRKKRRAKKAAANTTAQPPVQQHYADHPHGGQQYYDNQQYSAQPHYADKSQQAQPYPQELQSDGLNRGELDGQGYYKPENRSSGHPQNYYELPGRSHLRDQAHELPGNPRGM